MAKGVVNENAQVQQAVKVAVAGVLDDLRVLFPLEDPRKLVPVVQGVVADQFRTMPQLIDAYVNKPEYTLWRLRLSRESAIAGGASEELGFWAPKRVEDCKTLEEVLKNATIIALINSPTARAVLAKMGYRLGFAFGAAATKAEEPT